METVEHHGRTTAFRHSGESDESGVLYVHGSGGTHRVWAAQYGPDGPARPAITVDLSGHGESEDVETDPGPETLAAYVEDVSAVAALVNADVFVGNSLGGAVVLQAVLDGTVDPAALVLVGTGAKLAVHERLRDLLDDDFTAAIELLHDDDRLFHAPDEETAQQSKAEMRTVGRRVTRRDFLTCDSFDVRDRLGEIDAPTLAICGEDDELTPPSYHEYLADSVRDGRFEVIPDAAHLAMVERADAFGRTVEAFLDSIDPRFTQ